MRRPYAWTEPGSFPEPLCSVNFQAAQYTAITMSNNDEIVPGLAAVTRALDRRKLGQHSWSTVSPSRAST